MNNENAQTTALADYNPGRASLIDMRADAERFPRICRMPKEQAVLGLSKIVTQAFLYKGQVADPANINFIASSLLEELLADDRFGACFLSLAEIQVIVKRAVLGDAEMYGISVASLYKVIMDYAKGEGHTIQKQLQDARQRERTQSLKASSLGVMLQAYTGEYLSNNKK